jgi:hypothetical protein
MFCVLAIRNIILLLRGQKDIKIMKTFQDYLDMDGGIAFNLAIFNRFSSIGDSCYSEICGGFIDGVYQWADHNINFVGESWNDKYYGYTIEFNSGATRRVYIEKWVLALTPKDWKHAKSLFNKFLKEDIKFNQSESAMSKSYSY